MATTPTQIRIDEKTKKQAVELLEGLGLNLSEAINIFFETSCFVWRNSF